MESTDDQMLQLFGETDAHGMQQIQQMMVEPWQKIGWRTQHGHCPSIKCDIHK